MLIDTKFKIGDVVFFMVDCKIYKGTINKIDASIYSENSVDEEYIIKYSGDRCTDNTIELSGKNVFSSLDEIIDELINEFNKRYDKNN